jgi:hypothetical protein
MKAITANRLTDGRVIYRTEAGYWSPEIGDAHHLDIEIANRVLSIAETEFGIAVGPYLIDIDDAGPSGQKWRRESIRIAGPSAGSTRLIEAA